MYSNMHTIGVATAFGHGVDILKSVRDEIATDYSTSISGTDVAEVLSIEMHSANTFTVRVNAETILEARPVDSEYVVKYKGFIDYIVFDGNSDVTLTYFLVGWTKASKEWFEVTMATNPANKTVTLTDGCGNTVYAAASGKYYLHGGTYIAKTSNVSNYDNAEHKFVVLRDMTETVVLNPTEFFITFNINKTAAIIDYVKDSNGNEIAPYMNGVYKLANSTVGGTYTYSVSCTGYDSKTGTLTVTQDATETVSFVDLASIAITTPPTKTQYVEGQSFLTDDMVVTATYSDSSTAVVTTYTYEPSGALTVEDTKITVSYTEGDIVKTAEQAITVVAVVLSSVEIATPPTKTTYTVGEYFDPAGMVVKAVYNNGTKVEVSDYGIYPDEPLALGISHVVISYTEGSTTKTVDQLITVIE